MQNYYKINDLSELNSESLDLYIRECIDAPRTIFIVFSIDEEYSVISWYDSPCYSNPRYPHPVTCDKRKRKIDAELQRRYKNFDIADLGVFQGYIVSRDYEYDMIFLYEDIFIDEDGDRLDNPANFMTIKNSIISFGQYEIPKIKARIAECE